MDYRSLSVSIAVFIILVVSEIIIYGFYTGITELNEAALEKESAEGSKKAERVIKLRKRPLRLYAFSAFISTFAGVISGALLIKEYTGLISIYMSGKNTPIWLWGLLLVLIVTLLVIILLFVGILVPRKLALHKPEKWAYRLLPCMNLILVISYPVIVLSEMLTNCIVRLFGIDPYADTGVVTEEEIVSMVNEGQEQGLINSNEAEMINNIIEFSDKEAVDVMIHRVNVIAFDGSMKLGDAIEKILDEGYSRIPIYKDRIDDVIGILHLKDAIMIGRQKELLDSSVSEIDGLLRPPVFIPETRKISDLLKTMQSRTIHQVIVVDEYGQMAGIVTMEDILEEIVGNIFDEYDANEKFIKEIPEGYIMDGKAPLEEVLGVLGYDGEIIENLDYDTLNGFLISLLDRIPEEDEFPVVSYGKYVFKVEKINNKKIESVLVVKNQTLNFKDSDAVKS